MKPEKRARATAETAAALATLVAQLDFKSGNRLDYITSCVILDLSSSGPSGVDYCPGLSWAHEVSSERVGGRVSGHDAPKSLHWHRVQVSWRGFRSAIPFDMPLLTSSILSRSSSTLCASIWCTTKVTVSCLWIRNE
eukprot:229024-Rhodomonas_salina.2